MRARPILRESAKLTAIGFCWLGLHVPIEAQTPWAPNSTAKPAYSVIYTGKLFGYFRYPDEQSTSDQSCPDPGSLVPPAPVQEFRSALGSATQPGVPEVLVSLGDDFSPELLARFMRNRLPGTPYFGELVSKDLFTADAAGERWSEDTSSVAASDGRSPLQMSGKVPADNVGCFLRLAGFQAVVPGQEDFYFGPERLRLLARFLAEPATQHDKPVQMLAANLTIETSLHNPAPPLPASALPKAIQAALAANPELNIALPGVVLPWLRTISVTGGAANQIVFDCPAEDGDPHQFQLPSQEPTSCRKMPSDPEDQHRYLFSPPPHPSQNFVPDLEVLDPGSNHAVCVQYMKNDQVSITCREFTVKSPLLQYQPHASGSTPRPYVVMSDHTGKGIAIFGVLDPSLRGLVGQFNASWMNTNRRFDTTIDITEPVESLRQQLQACQADSTCRDMSKILLAQMPYHLAAQIATKLDKFDLILSQPDRDHQTEEESISRVLSKHAQPRVLTPGIPFDASRPDPLSANLRRADVFFGETAGQPVELVENKVFDAAIPAPANAHEKGIAAMESAVRTASGHTGPLGSAKDYEELALSAMQQFCKSDVALLQHRDVFSRFRKAAAFWPAGNSYSIQQWLDEVLWKGDFAFCLPMKGSALKKVLEESAAFDAQDRSDLSLEIQRGRGLSTLGISNDPANGVAMIRGQVIDGDKLYGVALTDYLAFGDTGYPEISSEAVLPRVRVTNLKNLNRLTGLACERLATRETGSHCQSEEISAKDYFDAITQGAPDSKPGLTALRQLRVWATHPVQEQRGAVTLVSQPKKSTEAEVENRALWWFTLQNLAFEYDLTFIRGSDKSVPANFSGINTFSQLSTPEQQQIGLWTRVRGGYSFQHYLDFYVAGEMRYTRNSIRVSDASGNGNFGPYQLTLKDNAVRSEFGLLSKPLSPRVPVRFLVSENLFTQIADPFQQLNANLPCATPGCTPTTTLSTFSLGKNFLVMSRIGARLQNRNSWFEAGREYGENIGVPTGYQLADVGRPAPFSCSLAGNLSLSECIATDPLFTTESQVLPNRANQRLNGWFMNFHSAAPIYRSNLQLTVDSYAEAFDRRADDTSFNTRFYEDLTVSLKVPLWGNLVFAPQVETFFFQNKIVPTISFVTNHYTFVTSSIKLEYGFDWHRGVGIGRALRYPSPLSDASSPVTPAPAP